ncbi:MAG: hypothetical protein EON58_15010 [Alphaproteobacteria bacterium]|nr:MAG: hypothetical protein EON58_15010 [Alphaproteobacteria bacterium]
MTLTASLPDQPELLVNTDLVLVPGKPLWVARDVYAGKTLDLMASATNVLLDGDSLDQRIMIQKGDATVTMVTGRPGEELIECGDSGWLAIMVLPDEFLMHNPVFGDGQPEIPDPFANESPKKMRSRFDEKAITPPPALKPWVDHEMVDIKSRFAVAMPAANDEGLMAGCDPIRKKIYLHGRSRELVESIREQFLNLLPGLDDGPQPMVATTINGREVTRLVTRAHQIGKLVRQAGKNNERRHVEFEPNPGDGRDLLDLKMYYEDKPDHGTSLLLNSNPTLRNGSALQIVSGESSGGDASSLRVSCEVIDVPGK